MNKSNKSRKEVDFNQFVMYPENPITKEGVFEYLGESLDREGELGLIPDKMYNVYRPASSLKDPNFLKSLELYPIFLDHHFVSGVPKSGFESPDDVVPRGAIGQKIYFDEDSGELRADIKVFSPLLKKTIEAGKKDISLGYFSRYIPEKGEWNGIPYDFVQTEMIANHASCVQEGRCGPSVAFADSADAQNKRQDFFTINIGDSLEMKSEAEKNLPGNQDEDVDYTPVDATSEEPSMDEDTPAENIRDIANTVLQKAAMITEDPVTGLSPAEVEALQDPNEAEEIAEFVEDEEDDDMEKKDKSEDEEEDDDEEDKTKSADKKPLKKKSQTIDSRMVERVVKDIYLRNQLVKCLGKHVNMKGFSADSKTFKEVQLYGVKKLGLNCKKGNEMTALNAYFKGRNSAMSNLSRYAKQAAFSDSADKLRSNDFATNFYKSNIEV